MPGEGKHMNTDKMTFALYHANAKGTGTALRMGVCNASESGVGYLTIEMAAQKEIGNKAGTVSAMFDWDGKWGTRFRPSEIAKMLQVFRGINESIDYGRGLCHRTADGNITHRIWLRHVFNTASVYPFEVARVEGEKQAVKRTFVFADYEALALCEALSGSMSRICFA